eukprot:7423998-Alexandrium_andersonii.AAC.1
MSASLVGSEMCIRDRGSGARSRGSVPTPEVVGQKGRTALSVRERRLRACLLYTSDAADDM